MSDSQWGVVADEDLPDAPGPDPADKRPQTPKDTQTPVTLTLALPKEVTTAITMVADRLERVALAIEENTKEVAKLASGKNSQTKQQDHPPVPPGFPPFSAWSPSRKMWRHPDGKLHDVTGNPVSA